MSISILPLQHPQRFEKELVSIMEGDFVKDLLYTGCPSKNASKGDSHIYILKRRFLKHLVVSGGNFHAYFCGKQHTNSQVARTIK